LEDIYQQGVKTLGDWPFNLLQNILKKFSNHLKFENKKTDKTKTSDFILLVLNRIFKNTQRIHGRVTR